MELNTLRLRNLAGGMGSRPALLAALSLALLFGVVGCSRSSAAALSGAKKAYEAGKYAESEKALTEVLKSDPKNVDAMRAMALSLAAQGRNEDAIEQYTAIIRSDPKDDQALYGAALIERRVGETRNAIKHLEGAARIRPGSRYSDELARTYMQVGRYADAIRQWEQVLRQPDTNTITKAGIYSATATAYESARQYDKARQTLRKALDLTPNDKDLGARLKALGG
jgi:tetratricopeptide (TPR) repeat protein